MASVERRTRNGRTRWYVRYRDPGGEQRTKTFDRRVDAERYLTTIESSKLTGSYVDPARRTRTPDRADQADSRLETRSRRALQSFPSSSSSSRDPTQFAWVGQVGWDL